MLINAHNYLKNYITGKGAFSHNDMREYLKNPEAGLFTEDKKRILKTASDSISSLMTHTLPAGTYVLRKVGSTEADNFTSGRNSYLYKTFISTSSRYSNHFAGNGHMFFIKLYTNQTVCDVNAELGTESPKRSEYEILINKGTRLRLDTRIKLCEITKTDGSINTDDARYIRIRQTMFPPAGPYVCDNPPMKIKQYKTFTFLNAQNPGG